MHRHRADVVSGGLVQVKYDLLQSFYVIFTRHSF